MPFISVVVPRYTPDDPAVVNAPSWQKYPPKFWPVNRCKFSYLKETEFIPHMEYGLYQQINNFINTYYPQLGNAVRDIPYYIDYSIWNATWWGGQGLVDEVLPGYGWYWVSIPANPTTILVEDTQTPSTIQPTQKVIGWSESDEDDGLPNFGIVTYTASWNGPKPW